jgi:spermidine/putrescine transport system permease protein
MTDVAADRVRVQEGPGTAVGRFRNWISNPWAKARFLWLIAIGYSVWALLPVVIAVVYSFNSGRSQTSLQGLSLRWYLNDVSSVLQDVELRSALLQSFKLTILVVLIAVPFGVAFALALDRWRGRGTGTANFVMLFSFITPEVAIGVALFLFFGQLLTVIGPGFGAQVLGLSMFEMAYPVIIVRARLLSIGKEYEEAAMDLGASPTGALRRDLLPMLGPAILASFAVVFATAIDDFVIAQRLSTGQSTQTVPILIYSSARRAPLPSLNALATITLVASTAIIALAFLVYRRSTKRDRLGDQATDMVVPG